MNPLPSISFWEQQWLKNTDILVIGSGIVGLQSARHLKLQWPHREVWVIDRAPVSLGASTRNAGFACFGSMGEILDDIESAKEAGTIPWVDWSQPLRLDIRIVEQV